MAEPQIWIEHGGRVQGPFPRSKVLVYIAAGRVRADMQFSVDGGPWVQGRELPELFPPEAQPPPLPPTPAAAPPAPAPVRRAAAPAPTRRAPAAAVPRKTRVRGGVRRGPPSGYLTAAILDFVFGGLGMAGGGFVAWASGRALEMVKRDPERILEAWANPELVPQLESLVTLGWVFVVAGVVATVAGLYVRTGAPEARTTQFIVSVACIGVCVWGLAGGWVGFITLGGLASQAAAIFVMVQLRPERAPPARGRRR